MNYVSFQSKEALTDFFRCNPNLKSVFLKD